MAVTQAYAAHQDLCVIQSLARYLCCFPQKCIMKVVAWSMLQSRALAEQAEVLVCSACRRVMFLVKAGAPVDATIESVKGMLESGDILIDGGNEW